MFGTNPYGDPMFRVIWSESRYYLVGAAHRIYDGNPVDDRTLQSRGKDPNLTREETGYRWLPLYPGRGRWVMEMWKSPFGFTGCTPEQYEILYRDPVTNLLTLGPYPTRGEYAECSVQFQGLPSRDDVEKKIYLIKAGWNYSVAEKAAANREALQRSEKSKNDRFKDMFKDSQQAFNNNPVNIRPGKRTKEQVVINQSAEEAGLVTTQGFQAGTPQRS